MQLMQQWGAWAAVCWRSCTSPSPSLSLLGHGQGMVARGCALVQQGGPHEQSAAPPHTRHPELQNPPGGRRLRTRLAGPPPAHCSLAPVLQSACHP